MDMPLMYLFLELCYYIFVCVKVDFCYIIYLIHFCNTCNILIVLLGYST